MSDEIDINATEAQRHRRDMLRMALRYALAAVAIITGVCAWRCEPCTACEQDLAKCGQDRAMAQGEAAECRRWTP